MRGMHMSTGAWLFASIVTAALVAPAGVYAAVNSRVAIGNPGNTVTASVDAQHQLLTSPASPSDIIRIFGGVSASGCSAIYSAPAGKALVLLSFTMDIRGTNGSNNVTYIEKSTNCNDPLDLFATVQAYDSQQHVYPAGLPVGGKLIVYDDSSAGAFAAATGYLIPAGQMPPSAGLRKLPARH